MWPGGLEKDGKKGGKKGGKKKGGKKGKRKKSPKRKNKPTQVKSIANVQRYIFQDEERFLTYLPDMDLSLPLYVYFRSTEIPFTKAMDSPLDTKILNPGMILNNPTSEDPIEDGLMKFIRYMQEDPDSKDIIFATVGIDPNKLERSPLRQFPKLRLEELPAVVRWGGPEKLEGRERCANQDLLCLLFEDRARRGDACPPNTAIEQRFSDNNRILCPFLPSHEDLTLETTEELQPQTRGKIKKKKKKKKKKKDKKKGKKKKK